MNGARSSGVLACAVAAALGSASTAEATTYTAVLKRAVSHSGSGTLAGNIASSVATWSYDDVTNQLTSTGGTFNVRFTITPTTTLFRHSIAGLVIGNGGAATATDYSCAEGNFGPGVGASLCGNYNFGANQINESTAVWGPRVSFNRTVGGDDMALGPQQNIDAYSYFATISWVGTTLTLRNASCNPSAPGNANGCATTAGFNTGYTWTLEAGPQVAPPDINDDTATAESGVATVIDVLANDTGVTGAITVTVPSQPANGTAVVNGDNTITYTSNGAFTGSDPFTYNVVADNLPNPGLNGTVTVTVVDTVPDAFTFTSLADQALNTPVQSDTVTITGLGSQAVAISVADGEYSVGCSGTFTSAAGTINNNDQVCLRQTTAATPATPKITTLTVGGGSGTFTTTTEAADNVPNAFSFTANDAAIPGEVVQSNTVAITGTNVAVPISISAGGEYSLDCSGTFTAADGSIAPGQSVCVRQTASDTPLTTTEVTLTVGGVDGVFSVTTVDVIPDTTPDQFQFIDQPNVDRDTVITSDPVTITGINVPVPISVQGGTYSIGCTDTFTAAPGTISEGQTVCVQQTSASTARTVVTTILSVGDPAVSDAFSTGTGGVSGPVASDDEVATEAGVPVVIAVLSNDTGFVFPKTVGIFTNPQHGTVQIVGSGVYNDPVITYTPSVGFQGVDTFAYLIQSSTGTDTAVVTVNVIVDADGDGVYDSVDNCLGASNPDQRDGDNDGYGTWCDADFNNDGRVNFADLSAFRTKFGTNDATADFNGDGVVNLLDLGRFKALFGGTPGPSGGNP